MQGEFENQYLPEEFKVVISLLRRVNKINFYRIIVGFLLYPCYAGWIAKAVYAVSAGCSYIPATQGEFVKQSASFLHTVVISLLRRENMAAELMLLFLLGISILPA